MGGGRAAVHGRRIPEVFKLLTQSFAWPNRNYASIPLTLYGDARRRFRCERGVSDVKQTLMTMVTAALACSRRTTTAAASLDAQRGGNSARSGGLGGRVTSSGLRVSLIWTYFNAVAGTKNPHYGFRWDNSGQSQESIFSLV